MVTHREVIVVAGPTEEETEDTDNINVERLWDDQLHYLISIAGEQFLVLILYYHTESTTTTTTITTTFPISIANYHISIAGRSFHIGGQVPVTFNMVPLSKIKIHQIAVYLEGTLSELHFTTSTNVL